MSRRVGFSRWLTCLVSLSICLASGCTAPNPDYPEVESCSPGQRKCKPASGQTQGPRALVCGRGLDDEFIFIEEACPASALCDGGRCVPPQDAAPCARHSDCAAGQSCVPLVDNGALKGFCITSQSAAGLPGDACAQDQNCQSYHCLQQAAGRYCLLACGSDNHCPLATPRCQALNVTITGVQGMVGSCSPR